MLIFSSWQKIYFQCVTHAKKTLCRHATITSGAARESIEYWVNWQGRSNADRIPNWTKLFRFYEEMSTFRNPDFFSLFDQILNIWLDHHCIRWFMEESYFSLHTEEEVMEVLWWYGHSKTKMFIAAKCNFMVKLDRNEWNSWAAHW